MCVCVCVYMHGITLCSTLAKEVYKKNRKVAHQHRQTNTKTTQAFTEIQLKSRLFSSLAGDTLCPSCSAGGMP